MSTYKSAIEKNGMSVDEFSKLLDPNKTLTPDELRLVDKVRADVGLPESGTVMNKTIPQSDIYNYLYNEKYNSVRGFVSVDEHSSSLTTLDDVFEGNRLDYNNTAFKTGNGVDGISQSVGNADSVYGKITYVLEDADGVKVPTDFPTVVFFASTFWTKLQNIFGHCCMSKLDKVAKPWLAMFRPAL